MTRHSTKCVDFSLAFFGFFGSLFRVVTSSNRWQKQQEISFQKEKNLEVERGEKKTTVTGRGGENIHLSLSFCIHTHTEFLTLISHTMATFSAAKVRIQRNSFLLALVCCSRRRFPPAFSPDALFFSANHRKWMCA